MRLIELTGDHFDMGLQHGRQVYDLRPQILLAMQDRLSGLAWLPEERVRIYSREMAELWETINRPTMEMLRGIAQSLELEWEIFFRYTVGAYLADQALDAAPFEGCTAWAAAGEATQNGEPVLAKNRDFRPTHQELQCLARARPAEGYSYLYVTSAGSPGVYSSGMNEAGLAVVDTHVASLDMGPGLPRYSVMMDLLEHFDRVNSALEYLSRVPHIGNGNLALLDADGEMAVFETGHSSPGIVQPEDGFVVCTNHFVTPALRQRCIDRNPPELRGNTYHRYAWIRNALLASRGEVNLGWAWELMSSHNGPLDSICRHPEIEPQSVTLSTAFYFPRKRELTLSAGLPCSSAFQTYPVLS